uniref:Legumain n=1 Tax=Panagrolaimus sp. ES5 TaxID=591445 RepID=A0AC34F159_9BILA
MMFDDIANNEKNPYPGEIYNIPNGKNVYEGVKIDYSGKFVNAEIFLNVLKGNKSGNVGKGSERVLESEASDNVFIFYVSHGDFEILGMPVNSVVHKNDLNDAFKIMHENKMFKNMLFYLESCRSGSMFTDLNPELNIYSITASSDSESSHATYCSNANGLPCIGDLFSVNWMADSETHDIQSETIGTQFNEVKKATTSSHVSEYGNKLIRSDIVAFYQGSTDNIKCPDPITYGIGIEDVLDSSEVELLMVEKYAYQSGLKKSQVFSLMKNYTKMRTEITEFVMDFVKETVADEKNVGKVLTMKLSKYTQNNCHKNVLKAFSQCIPFGSNPYALRFSQIFANLCEILKNESAIIKNLNEKCQNGPLFMGVI